MNDTGSSLEGEKVTFVEYVGPLDDSVWHYSVLGLWLHKWAAKGLAILHHCITMLSKGEQLWDSHRYQNLKMLEFLN